ncbi:MAG: hypothetical protein LPJ89_09630, partial [Hymenobacteraceae bacterium]|nr:hypothetical protein [Hymenobacteraceae bacterium]MDX5396088.1 hypothetical protein [Hymenobacteraceae bacterium]MDX5444026.1 hypothetical protein [Hymenobacteraceae bacterium]MDX5512153.1 hypothetical protein [Hymenobacteraceae bacterium]
SFTIVETYKKGQVIFMYDDLIVEPDKPVVMPPADASPLEKLYLFIRYNTSYFFRMAGLRFLLFWGHVKPYYSLFHNLIIAAVFYPLYFFTAKTMLSSKIRPEVAVFAAMVLAQQAFITTMTSEDWTGRFLISVIPLVFVLGSVGLSRLLLKRIPALRINLIATPPPPAAP